MQPLHTIFKVGTYKNVALKDIKCFIMNTGVNNNSHCEWPHIFQT